MDRPTDGVGHNNNQTVCSFAASPFPLPDPTTTGLKILSVYMTGSKNMSYDSASLTTSDIKVNQTRPAPLSFPLLLSSFGHT